MKIGVGSTNPVKINATIEAFKAVWPDENWHAEGISVPSNVSDQPMSDTESIRGATNRAKNILEHSDFDYGIGIEGGLQKINRHWFDTGWVVIIDQAGMIGIGSAGKMMLPSKIMDLIHKGKELGEANDIVFNRTNSKQAEGHFGLMTNNLITRTDAYSQAIIFALTPFVQVDIYESK